MTAQSSHNLVGRRILLVEDEVLIAMELEGLLREEGVNVIGPASSCAKALDLIEDDGLDACVLDLNLNGKPVGPVATELQRRGVPFVVVSGYAQSQADEPERLAARRLSKPVDEKRLLKALTEVVDERRGMDVCGTTPKITGSPSQGR